jgi:hypothetical protein
MKYIVRISSLVIVCLVILASLFAPEMNAAANANPTWYVDARVINHGQCLPYDYYAAKDPTIVYYGGKYHVFYTGANQSGGWQMLYTSASTIDGLKTASRTYMSKIGESYFCAPEVFYCEPKGLWYLVYQDGTCGAAYATSTNVGDPNSWSGPKSFGISGNMGWDYYIIFDDNYAYMYNTPDSGNHNIYMRRTTIANFPNGWSSPTVSITDTFEGAEVYKSLADGQYYLLVEDMKDGRYYECWTSSSAGGPWTKVAEKWAWRGNLKYNADQWTTNVSHGELIRAGYNQKLEINDINRVDFLIQGTTNTSGDYQKIIWDLGVIHNYSGPTTSPVVTPTPIRTPTAVRTATPRVVTPTPVQTATPVRTATPPPATPTPVPTTGSIKIQFYNQSTAASSNQIYLNIKVVNTGSSAVALSNVKIRYYYTINGAQTQNFYCDYTPVGSSNVTGSFVTMSAAKTGADAYVEVGFSSGAGSLAAGGNTTVQARVAKSDWTNYTQTDDYSFNSSATTFVDWTKVTGYVSGALQWGTEP